MLRGGVNRNICLNQKALSEHCPSSIAVYRTQVLDYIVNVSLLAYQI